MDGYTHDFFVFVGGRGRGGWGPSVPIHYIRKRPTDRSSRKLQIPSLSHTHTLHTCIYSNPITHTYIYIYIYTYTGFGGGTPQQPQQPSLSQQQAGQGGEEGVAESVEVRVN